MTLAQFTHPNLIIPRLSSESRDYAIADLSNLLERAGRIENARAFASLALNHESFVSSIFNEVAFSLARGRVARELSFAMGLSPSGIIWDGAKAQSVHTIVLFAVPPSVEQSYMSLLVTFSHFLKDQSAFSALHRCVRADEIFNVLNRVHLQPASHTA